MTEICERHLICASFKIYRNYRKKGGREKQQIREKIKELEVYFRLRLKNKRGGDHENFRIIMANVLTIDHGIESIKSVG